MIKVYFKLPRVLRSVAKWVARWAGTYYAVLRNPVVLDNPPTARVLGQPARLESIAFRNGRMITLRFAPVKVRRQAMMSYSSLHLADAIRTRPLEPTPVDPGNEVCQTWDLVFRFEDEEPGATPVLTRLYCPLCKGEIELCELPGIGQEFEISCPHCHDIRTWQFTVSGTS
jgi:hypothetical protein